MTTNAQPDRLDRIEALVESNACAIAELSQHQLRMVQEFSDYQRDMLETRADIQEMQAEVRGLQTENRRILDRVFGEQ